MMKALRSLSIEWPFKMHNERSGHIQKSYETKVEKETHWLHKYLEI